VSWKHSLLLVLVIACKKDARERAIEILDDESLATPDALAKAATVYYPKAKTWAEGADQNWRVFVIVDRAEKPYVEKTGTETKITYYGERSGEDLVNDGVLLGIGGKRGLGEVLVAERYHASVGGRDVKVLDVHRTRPSGHGAQILSHWAPEDLEKAKPYDMLMNEKSVLPSP
jgi:hypothetical protein